MAEAVGSGANAELNIVKTTFQALNLIQTVGPLDQLWVAANYIYTKVKLRIESTLTRWINSFPAYRNIAFILSLVGRIWFRQYPYWRWRALFGILVCDNNTFVPSSYKLPHTVVDAALIAYDTKFREVGFIPTNGKTNG